MIDLSRIGMWSQGKIVLKKAARSWLVFLGENALWLSRLCLLVSWPFPRLYVFIARHTGLGQAVRDRTWRIQSGPLRGVKLADLLPDEIAPVLANSMELRCSNLLARLSLGGSIVLDVGGSWGYYALLLSRLVGASGCVYSFEPDWDTYKRLTRNITINRSKNLVAVPVCLSDSTVGLVKWRSFQDEPWNSRIWNGEMAKHLPVSSSHLMAVPVTTLDDFIQMIEVSWEKIRLVKIDVEGAEFKVLRGAVKMLSEAKPLIMCELHGADVAKRVFDFLADLGYQWKMIEYTSETRQHILAFVYDQADVYRKLI